GEFMSNLGMMRSDGWKQGVNWRECVNWNQFNSLVFNAIPAEREGGAVVGRRFEKSRLARSLADMRDSQIANASQRIGGGAAQPRSAAGRLAETRRPAPERRETFEYSVSYGILGSPQRTFTFKTASPITDYSERWLSSALRNPPGGFVALESGRQISPERRLALAAEIELQARDPIGTFAITPAAAARRRRKG
ncbi:hypothetical protein L0Y65_02800, partial [Candidatus Micrarchaeota archaeon]|nr:hypothetical protein [Candidatus Micrarchaeota archaeon]